MTFNDLISLCHPVDVSGPQPETIGLLTQDSRKVKKGSVFIAIRGTKTDGHLFIENAVSKGASVVICEEAFDAKKTVCTLQVSDTRSLLGPLAQAFQDQPAKDLKIIGITGTNGKTTVATLTYQTLKKLGAQPALLSTVSTQINDEIFESQLTTPDPINLAERMAKMKAAGSSHLVMETSSHALDQKRLNGFDFSVAAFTNLSHDHLDYHGTMQNYARAKKKLFDGLNEDAWAIINGDDKRGKFITKDCSAQIVDFSFSKTLSVSCDLLSSTLAGLTLSVDQTTIKSPLAGTFNAYNVAQTFLICRALDFDDEDIAGALTSVKGSPGRMERIEDSGEDENPVVFVDYAHTPDALKNILKTLAELKKGGQKLDLIFGCGGDRDRSKRSEMASIAERYADKITVTTDNPRSEDPDDIIDEVMKGFVQPENIQRITNREQAIRDVIRESNARNMIVIAGKGHETYQEIKGKRYDFDDRKVARQALSRRKDHKNHGVG